MARGPNWKGIAKAKVPVATAVREATQEDVERLRQQAPLPKTASRLKKLKDGHHWVAMLIASGYSNVQINEITGRSLNSISMLRSDPAMLELVAGYRDHVRERVFDGATETLRNVEKAARIASRQKLELLQAVDEGDAEPLPVRDLVAIESQYFDRFGPIKAKANITAKGDFADQLAQMIERSEKAKLVGSESPVLTSRAELQTPSSANQVKALAAEGAGQIGAVGPAPHPQAASVQGRGPTGESPKPPLILDQRTVDFVEGAAKRQDEVLERINRRV
jgi:hypothetical protein